VVVGEDKKGVQAKNQWEKKQPVTGESEI